MQSLLISVPDDLYQVFAPWLIKSCHGPWVNTTRMCFLTQGQAGRTMFDCPLDCRHRVIQGAHITMPICNLHMDPRVGTIVSMSHVNDLVLQVSWTRSTRTTQGPNPFFSYPSPIFFPLVTMQCPLLFFLSHLFLPITLIMASIKEWTKQREEEGLECLNSVVSCFGRMKRGWERWWAETHV